MKKQLVSVRFFCTIAGHLWWYDGLATKELDVTFTPTPRAFTRKWTGLEDALDYLMLHGADYRDAPTIVNCTMEITWQAGKDTITRYAALPVGKLTAPYMADNLCLEG